MASLSQYFDHNATTPLHPSAFEAWGTAQRHHWQNPSSLYHNAGLVRRLLEEAREQLAELLNTEPERILFTSGATEGCNFVFRQYSHQSHDQPVCISAIEHPCVRDAAYHWFGHERVLELPTTSSGMIDPDDARKMIASRHPALVSLMAANNETGVIQPWKEIAAFSQQEGIPYHCDAAQWIGKMPLDGLATCDWVTGSAHKFGGPKGTGWLIIPEHTPSAIRLQVGGPQEAGHRAGTESYPDIAAMLAALQENVPPRIDGGLRDRFEQSFLLNIPEGRILGSESPRLPNTSMVVMPSHSNLKWLTRLSERGFAVSTGSACSAGKGNPSHVLAAIGLEPESMGRVLRFSSGPRQTSDDWQSLANALEEIFHSLQSGDRGRRKITL